ncbi:glutamate 5-kinase [Halarcobacter sp.]|uniref:glutamate 5-kinase n=1 Tax=Halarcobacter sp. TaxID=2321133 RepID=UPI002AAB29BA|nr:glutamate 5-kinase [Halarcobacter sp.]|eukprot:Anaeramoba_ignava/a219533_14.p1 GENE.a219533_14~~a219533_14.p1  ORF type:complete len:267 (-),score=51.00 a219533_14:269-1069(-)
MEQKNKRIVIKVGSAVLREDDVLAVTRLNNLVDLIAKLKKEKNNEVILVSSGAVAAGNTKLNLDRKLILNRQALAAIGQPLLMKFYKKRFREHDLKCAQMLLVEEDFDSRRRSKNARGVMEILLENDIIPILNENDVIANQELLIGDNDQLAARAAYFFGADLLVILSDVDGLYDSNPHENKDAKMRKIVDKIEEYELEMKHTPNSEFATGGIVTKLKAANYVMKKGIPMYLSSGFDLTNAWDFLVDDNHNSGSLFRANIVDNYFL